nr:MAG TPA: hypothetical protein [Caudoviricetes sp.]
MCGGGVLGVGLVLISTYSERTNTFSPERLKVELLLPL